MLGIYLHVPFCKSKCPYCDFYSLTGWDGDLLDRYVTSLCEAIRRYDPQEADTLYFGGGTPSLLGGRRIGRLIDACAERFGLAGAEITLEANPADDLADTLRDFAAAGGNRLSLGMQAAVDRELAALGRRHRMADLYKTAEDAKRAGIRNLSLDLMLATPGQTEQSVRRAAEVCRELEATHLSAYLLKIEPGTPFAVHPPALPEEDAAADRYLLACRVLEQAGYAQYEISNFSLPGYESRHNLKYWNGDPYLGFGPAAHSFYGGKRWAYPRDLAGFLAGGLPVEERDEEIPAGSPEEYAMLRLRLTAGLTEREFAARFGAPVPADWKRRAAALPAGLVQTGEGGIRLTREGFLVSTPLIARILEGD